jgi:DNA-binding IclR family transcriptional regulator
VDQQTLDQVFAAVSAVEARGADVRLEQVAAESGLSVDDTRTALSELSHQNLVAEFTDDAGSRWTVKDRG